MKYNKWTLGLAAAGVVSLASAAQAEEAQKQLSQVMTAVASTTLSGYVDTSMIWKPGTGNANLPGRAFDGVGKLDVVSRPVIRFFKDRRVKGEVLKGRIGNIKVYRAIRIQQAQRNRCDLCWKCGPVPCQRMVCIQNH